MGSFLFFPSLPFSLLPFLPYFLSFLPSLPSDLGCSLRRSRNTCKSGPNGPTSMEHSCWEAARAERSSLDADLEEVGAADILDREGRVHLWRLCRLRQPLVQKFAEVSHLIAVGVAAQLGMRACDDAVGDVG